MRLGWRYCIDKNRRSKRSNGENREGQDKADRFAEAQGVRRILERKFGTERISQMRWMIYGDLNDYTERLAVTGNHDDGYGFELKQGSVSGLEPLFTGRFCEDLVRRRLGGDRWTLYHAAGNSFTVSDPEHREVRHLLQLDYMLRSPSLARANPASVSDILRRGQSYRTVFPPDQQVERYPRTGWDRPKATDHCPVAVTREMV